MRTTARRLGTIVGAAVFAFGVTATAATATTPHDDPVETGVVFVDPDCPTVGPDGSDDWEAWGYWCTSAEVDGVSWSHWEEWVQWAEEGD